METNNNTSNNDKQNLYGIPLNKIWYYRSGYIALVVILGLINKLLTVQYSLNSDNFFYTFLPEMLGGAIGIAIIPMIIGIVRFFLKKQPTINIYVIYAVISIVATYLATEHLIRLNNYSNGSSLPSTTKDSYTANSNSNSSGYNFNCSGNEYDVVFESEPKIYDSAVPIGDSILSGTTAELSSAKYKSFCRAECVKFNLSQFGNIDKEYFNNFLNQYSTYTGLSFPTFNYKVNNLGKIGSVRGFKTLKDDSGHDIEITFEAFVHYVNNSIMILYVGCPSENYPTRFISKFLNSIKRV